MLQQLTTESINPASERIDQRSAAEIVRLVHAEDLKVADAVGRVADQIAQAVERIADVMRASGRLVYLGAGTSGRLGVLVLNMLSTGAMIRLGKTYGNRMVDLKATNSKLIVRARRIVAHLTGLDEAAAEALLTRAGSEVKTAIAMHHRGVSAEQARELLHQHQGHLRKVIG